MKGIIVLFGAEKSGKTTTLKLLSDYFAGKTCMFDKHGDYKMVVKQNNSYVYVSSAGDDLPAIEDSIAFFKGKWPNKKRGARKALLINGGEMTGIDTDENYLEQYPPSVFVMACRTKTGCNMLSKKYQEYIELNMKHLDLVSWVRKERGQFDADDDKNNQLMADKLAEMINMFILKK